MAYDWDEFRWLMPVTKRWAYFDHAAVSPLPEPAREAIQHWLRQATEEGDTQWPQWAARVEQVRKQFAAALGAEGKEIAFVPNTTTGIGLVAEGFRWQAGDNVVTLANEFPSNLYPWMNLARRGVETRRAAVDEQGRVNLESLFSLCDQRTRMIAVSWVGYASGWRLDVDRLVEVAHRAGILVFLDAIQGLGVFPLDVSRTRVDFLAADGHKWLLGPEGAGVLYVRQENLARLDPLLIGWNSVVQQYDFSRIELNFREEAARYEGGSQNMVGVAALGASADLLVRFGWGKSASAIADRVLENTDAACQLLESRGARILTSREPQRCSGIVSFELPGKDSQAVRQHCFDAGVVLSCRGGRLRLSAHAYNNGDDLQRLADALGTA